MATGDLARGALVLIELMGHTKLLELKGTGKMSLEAGNRITGRPAVRTVTCAPGDVRGAYVPVTTGTEPLHGAVIDEQGDWLMAPLTDPVWLELRQCTS